MADEQKDDASSGGGESDADKAVKELAAKNGELLEELKKTRAKARDFEAAEAERQKQIADAEEEKARKSKDFETIEKNYQTKLQKAEAEALTFKSRYESLVIDRGLDEALAAAKVNPALAKAAHALIKAEHGVELSEDGKATITGKALADFVGDWSKSDTGKAFVMNGASGGGANGGGNGGGSGGDKNPFKPGSINLTEQGRLLRSDPTRARQLAQEAGVKL
jgi:hypothetical protein